MRLIDMVASASVPLEVGLGGRTYRLPGAMDFAQKVVDCPLRYVLGDDIRDATQTVVSQWPDLLNPTDRNLRVPAEQLWLEWADQRSDGSTQKFGLLMEASPSGRSGVFRSFWENGSDADVSQVSVQFDLDMGARRLASNHYPLAKLKESPTDLDAYLSIVLDEEWARFLKKMPERSITDVVHECAEYVWRDAYRLLAFSRLISSPIDMVRRPVERGRLNIMRAKGKKPPLLDHIELTMSVGEGRGSDRQSGGSTRSASRLHIVRGHLVRRRDKIFWRSTHLRGAKTSDKPLRKTVKIRMPK